MSRVVFSCVAENQPRWLPLVQNLVLSVREFGEGLADSPFVVHLVGGADPAITAPLERFDVEVRVVDPVDVRKPSANKLRMLELAGERSFDSLVMLDCDTVVMGDLTPAIGGAHLRALPAGNAALTAEQWTTVYAAAGVDVPGARTTMVRTGERTMPYYNSGVLVVPAALCEPLRTHWTRHLTWLLDGGLAAIGMEGLTKDQIPLALALASSGITVEDLPVNLNLSTTQRRAARAYRDQWGPPFVLHYHRQIGPDGFLRPSPWSAVNPWLDRFNQRRAAVLGAPYEGLGRVPLRVQLAAGLKGRRGYRSLRSWLRGAVSRPVSAPGGRPGGPPPVG